MTKISFSQLNLTPKVERAVGEMGFDFATPIQSESIPLIRTGVDVIARSQTGTGKTVAFAIPAIERIDTHEEKATIQVLVICPTRELAQQAADEIRKLAKFKTGIRPVEVYGGTSIEKQCIRLRRANIVIGTPGRVMDHMRRKTIKLSNLKMIVLDEADEMLSMGFKEDIETILTDTPETRQTVLFSATMPPAILKLTKEFQTDPKLIEIDKSQVTIKDIDQSYVEIPHNKKKDALGSLLKFHQPNRTIIFCNTKKMVDELTELLCQMNFSAEGIHSDIKQDQRTAVMQGFKRGKTSILIATDIAARGIDVSDVEFVINFDIPPNTEYYVHRIGRTGRAGKSGRTITLCSGRREVIAMRNIGLEIKSDITRMSLPTLGDIQKVSNTKAISETEEALQGEIQTMFSEMAEQLVEKGYTLQNIAAAALQLHFAEDEPPVVVLSTQFGEQDMTSRTKKRSDSGKSGSSDYETVLIDIGSTRRITAHHIVGAIADRTSLSGSAIGKIDIFPEQTVVEIPTGQGDEVVEGLAGCRICGKAVRAEKLAEPYKKRRSSSGSASRPQTGRGNSRSYGSSYGKKKPSRPR